MEVNRERGADLSPEVILTNCTLPSTPGLLGAGTQHTLGASQTPSGPGGEDWHSSSLFSPLGLHSAGADLGFYYNLEICLFRI